METLINSRNLMEVLCERLYETGFENKSYDLTTVQAFWSNALVCFGDVPRAEAIAIRATSQLSSVEKEHIRAQLPVTQWQDYLAREGAEIWPDVLVNAGTEVDIEKARAAAISRIDRDAEALRLNFITPGFGQLMAYQQKLQEAEAFMADTEINPNLIPHIVSEAQALDISLMDAASAVVTIFHQWQGVSSIIEGVRIGAKDKVALATTVEEVELAADVDWSSILTQID
jgi:hypothetical protein